MTPTLPENVSIIERAAMGPVLVIDARGSRAEIALHGATVISFVPTGGRPVLWLSKNASCESGRPIRGGVPICAPWFGPHPSVKAAPQHGFVRAKAWDLAGVEELSGGELRAEFSTDIPACAKRGWAHEARAEFSVTVGTALSMELVIHNTGEDAFALSEALHSYFFVSDVRNVSVEGLENSDYIDTTGDKLRHNSGNGSLALRRETTCMFFTGKPSRIVDMKWSRAINIHSEGAASTVVWNPWEKTAANMVDIGAQWPEFICVETTNIPALAVTLAPNTSHRLKATISVEAM
jgi:glucose-6-phosphate 1-epimerase